MQVADFLKFTRKEKITAKSACNIRELVELKDVKEKINGYFPHQIFALRVTMLNPEYPILCMHSPGTGKSGIIIAICEHFGNNAYRGALVITKKGVIPQIKALSVALNITVEFNFQAHQQFANKLATLSDAAISEQYSGMVIAIDETHIITEPSNNTDENSAFLQIMRLVNCVKHCKFIISTATPMINSHSKLENTAQLLFGNLPREILGDIETMTRYIVDNAIVLWRPMFKAATIVKIGKLIVHGDIFYPTIMSEEQQEAYDNASHSNIYDELIRKSICIGNLKTLDDIRTKAAIIYRICKIENDAWINGEPGCTAIYCGKYIKEGLSYIVSAFKMMGWKEWNINDISEEAYPRYVIYTGDTTNQKAILDNFNTNTNWNGRDIRIILYSIAGRDGISLNHVLRTHRLVGEWNISSNIQSYGRFQRMNSFETLIVKIVQFASESWYNKYIKDGIVQIQSYNHVAMRTGYQNVEPEEFTNVESPFFTIGIRMQEISMEKNKIIEAVMTFLQKHSIEFRVKMQEYSIIAPDLYKDVKMPVFSENNDTYYTSFGKRNDGIFISEPESINAYTGTVSSVDDMNIYLVGSSNFEGMRQDIYPEDISKGSNMNAVCEAIENVIRDREDNLSNAAKRLINRYKNYVIRIKRGIWIHNFRSMIDAVTSNMVMRFSEWPKMTLYRKGKWKPIEDRELFEQYVRPRLKYTQLLEKPMCLILTQQGKYVLRSGSVINTVDRRKKIRGKTIKHMSELNDALEEYIQNIIDYGKKDVLKQHKEVIMEINKDSDPIDIFKMLDMYMSMIE